MATAPGMPVQPPDPGAGDNARNTGLLDAELPSHRFVDDRYLTWLYDENPYGPAIQRSVDDDGVRIGHYALVPQRFRGRDGVVPAAFSLNAVVRSGTQRKGLFTQMGLEIYEEAGAAGWQLTTGVCNEKSIGAVVKYMGWKWPGPLPVRLVVPLSMASGASRRTVSRTVDAAYLASAEFEQLAAGLDSSPVMQWTNSYTAEYLRWRLACPSTTYALHVTDELVAVTTTDKRGGIPAAVILKLLPRDGRRGPLRAEAIVSAACRYHRAPYAVYAGFNAHVALRGIQPPRRLQPSPLNLIIRSLSPAVDQGPLAIDTFEFLDMDAY
jgi:hypothetical protein